MAPLPCQVCLLAAVRMLITLTPTPLMPTIGPRQLMRMARHVARSDLHLEETELPASKGPMAGKLSDLCMCGGAG